MQYLVLLEFWTALRFRRRKRYGFRRRAGGRCSRGSAAAIYQRVARLLTYGPAGRSMQAMPNAEPTPWHIDCTDSLAELMA
ncbi:hypothetical protein MSIMFI_05409 [Mycobacterium simulans]|nr:hypothetical protein MSIMFI_05409 [Mycobacterium simulans]